MTCRVRFSPVLALLVFWSLVRSAAAVDAQIEAAVQAVYPALVRIHVVYEEGGGGRMQKGRASGSGTIISAEGHILTNHHVAGRATRITVRLADRQEVRATLVGTDPLADLAQKVSRELIATGRVKRSWTGLSVQPLLKNSAAKEGVLVGGESLIWQRMRAKPLNSGRVILVRRIVLRESFRMVSKAC